MSRLREADVLVVGAGMAGASLAAFLAPHARVIVLERERSGAEHTTGRSAALFSPIYGNATIRALSRASAPFLHAPPAGFCEQPLVRRRDTLFLTRADQAAALDALVAEVPPGALQLLDAAAVQARVPALRPGYAAAGALDTASADMDVDALHAGFLRQSRRAGAELLLQAEVQALQPMPGGWLARTPQGDFKAATVVNAAGAWADAVAALAGVPALGIAPLRRTAVLIDPPPGHAQASRDWPAIIDVDERWYAKPDAGLMLVSPADETPSPPCDAQPEEWDVALAIDRYQQAMDHDVQRLRHCWAGLRSFAPDRTPVVGFDPASPQGFFWLAGQGGYGIQTAPALGRAAAALCRGLGVPATEQAEGVQEAALSPARLRG